MAGRFDTESHVGYLFRETKVNVRQGRLLRFTGSEPIQNGSVKRTM